MRKIRIIEPPNTRKKSDSPTDAATNTIGPSTNSPEVLAVSRKRPFDNILDDSSAYKEEQKQRPPRKKARIDVHALVFPELYDDPPPQHPQPSSYPKKKKHQQQPSSRDESTFKSVNRDPARFSIFPKPSGKASRAVNRRFLRQIRRSQMTPADKPNHNIS